MTSCVFCDIIEGKRPAEILFENGNAIAIEDVNSDGILLIPKQHYECTPKSLAALASLLLQVPIEMGIERFEVEVHINWHVSINHLHIRIRPK